MKRLIFPLRWVAVIPASILIAIAVYFVFKGIINCLALFAPSASYGDTIMVVAIGMASYCFIVSAVVIAPKYKKAVAIILSGIITVTAAYQIGSLTQLDQFDFLTQIQFLAIFTGIIPGLVKAIGAETPNFDTFFN
jgi:hypothetical protein